MPLNVVGMIYSGMGKVLVGTCIDAGVNVSAPPLPPHVYRSLRSTGGNGR